MKRKIVIFDVGRVLVDFSHELFRDYLIKNGVSISSQEDFYQVTRLLDYEKGKISSKEFIQLVKSNIKRNVSETDIIEAWTNIFTPINEMLEFCKFIGTKCSTYILSNSNELHWNYLNENYDINSLTQKAFTSFEIGAMKPSNYAYEFVENTLECLPQDILFIDDMPENIEIAKSRGWKGIVHEDISITKANLFKLI